MAKADIHPAALRVLGILLAAGKPLTIRALSEIRGKPWFNGTYQMLKVLRQHGLVAWETKRSGTIRPTCRFIQAEDLHSDEHQDGL